MVARLALAVVLAGWAALADAGPKIQHWTLDNGARVYFVETHELPLVQVRAIFDAGSARDPSNENGVAAMTSMMLNEGAGNLDADKIAAGFDNVGAEFGAAADRDWATVDLRSLSDRKLLDPALEIYTTLLTQPAFPEKSLERERAGVTVALQRDEQSPGAITEKTFMRRLYGDHPYAHHPLGDLESVKHISRDQLVNFHKRHYVGANAWFVVVGDITAREARRIAQATVGKLPKGEALAPLPAPQPLAEGAVREIRFPATQSHIRLGAVGIARGDPDYFPLYVGNYILGGGGLVSRLSEQVRERNGYAYSVYSYFWPMRVPGPFMVGLQTKNATRAPALRLVRSVVERFVTEGPTDQELEAAKKHLTGGFPLKLDSNRKIADNLAVIAFYGLPLTYLDDFVGRIEAVTGEQIRDAFRRRVHPDKMLTVVVGGGR